VVQSQIERLAAAIADLCNDPAVAETGEWSVSLALRPDLLPRTTLMAAVSAHCLRLRFISDDPAARDLLLKRRDELHRLLDESLNRRLEISITLD
jgi:type III secretion control protein HpaP